jgi:hypothetical protein
VGGGVILEFDNPFSGDPTVSAWTTNFSAHGPDCFLNATRVQAQTMQSGDLITFLVGGFDFKILRRPDRTNFQQYTVFLPST